MRNKNEFEIIFVIIGENLSIYLSYRWFVWWYDE